MVEMVVDPENPYVPIPRFNDKQEMGDYWEEKNFKGKCVAAYDTIVPREAQKGDVYDYAYQQHSPIDPITLTILIIGIIIILCLVIYFVSTILAGVAAVLNSGTAETEDMGDTLLVKCKDGTTHTVDKKTGKIISGYACGKAPISSMMDWVTPIVIIIGVCVGGYVVYRLVKSGTAQKAWQKTKGFGHKIVG